MARNEAMSMLVNSVHRLRCEGDAVDRGISKVRNRASDDVSGTLILISETSPPSKRLQEKGKRLYQQNLVSNHVWLIYSRVSSF